MRFKDYFVVLWGVITVALVLAVYLLVTGSAKVQPVPLPEVRISQSSLVPEVLPTSSPRTALKGTQIASVASKSSRVLSVQVVPERAKTPLNASGIATSGDCLPVDLRIGLYKDAEGMDRAAVTDLSGGTVTAADLQGALTPEKKWTVALGYGILNTSWKAHQTLFTASVSRKVLSDVSIGLNAAAGRESTFVGISLGYSF